VIWGGGEASVIASKLALPNLLVILAPARCVPSDWNNRRCDQDNGLRTLVNAGVNVGLANLEFSFVRNLRWEAGMTTELGGFSNFQALSTITKNIGDFFDIDYNNSGKKGIGYIQTGTQANFVVFSGDPLSLKSSVEAVAVRSIVSCSPQQK